MRRQIIFITGIALACCLSACQRLQTEDIPAESRGNSLFATLETSPESRTTLSPGGNGVYKVIWSENDGLDVFIDGQTLSNHYDLSAGAGSGKGTFSGYGSGSRYMAYYPASGELIREGSDAFRTVLPAEQTYENNSFATRTCPMVAVGNSSELVFKNLASVLKISLTGRQNVTRITFRPKDSSAKVAGEATVSVADPSNPTLSVSGSGSDSLVLNTGGVILSETSPTDFYMVLPPRTYKGGFSVRIYTPTGYMVKTYSSDFTMVRSKVHEAAALKLKLTHGVDASDNLAGSGTESDPFQIGSAGDMLLLQQSVNGHDGLISNRSGKKTDARTAHYVLTADINLSRLCNEKTGSWDPIGSEGRPFDGSLNGNGHTVSGLYINAPGKDYQGLFGYTGEHSSMSGITVGGTIVDANLFSGLLSGVCKGTARQCVSTGSAKAHDYLGGLFGDVAYAYDCTNRAEVSGGSMIGGVAGVGNLFDSCVNEGSIRGEVYVGGIGGNIFYLCNQCVNKGQVHAVFYTAGGIAGALDFSGVVINGKNEGTVYAQERSAGIVGNAFPVSYILNSLNSGSVTGNETDLGGIVGQAGFTYTKDNAGPIVRNCINIGTVGAEKGYDNVKNIGGICGYSLGIISGKECNDAIIEDVYWLYDASAGLGNAKGIGLDEGKSARLNALNRSQMQATSTLNTLNTWAARTESPVQGIDFQGWIKDSKTGYPTLSGKPATK